MVDKSTIEHMLTESRPMLSAAERASVWEKVVARMHPVASPHTVAPVRSLYFFWTHLNFNTLAIPLVVVMLVVATGSAIAASDAAKPGDSLFALDRGVEKIRLALSTPSQGTALRAQFAHERLAELRLILDEEATADTALALAEPTTAIAVADHDTTAATMAMEAGTPTEAAFSATTRDTPPAAMLKTAPVDVPADTMRVDIEVFTDTTVVKIEQYGGVTRFTTGDTTRAAVVAAVAAQLGLTEAAVDAVTDFSKEDRPSRPAERGGAISSVRGEARVGTAVTAFVNGLSKVPEHQRQELLESFAREINVGVHDSNPVRGGTYPLRIDDRRVELEGDGVRVRLGGEQYDVRFDSDDGDKDEPDQRGGDDSRDNTSSHDDDRSGSGKVED